MKRMRLLFPAAAVLWAATLCPTSVAHAQSTRLLRHPAISHDAIAFEYGGDLWSVGRSGGTARRLTSTPEMETDPHFSPDGSMIAFSHTMGANTDVFVMPASGGEPRRLTFYPGINRVRGWSPDGRRVLFATRPVERAAGVVPSPVHRCARGWAG
jgi:tricorn protease